MKLNELKNNAGATKVKKRVGRGIASGTGKTAGRGVKGQKSRTGTGKPAVGFEGGQSPLYKRLPMRGFTNPFSKQYTIINVGQLQTLVDGGKLKKGQTITIETLQEVGYTKKTRDGLKVLGNGELKTELNIEAIAVTASAQEKVKQAGGKVTLLDTAPAPVVRKKALTKS